ncbi:trigger factor family protein, partial [Candidatus Saccharibacteria bacterium]|nr:trigger factor family protein [Candidatus Saccharibacteria bacterium]
MQTTIKQLDPTHIQLTINTDAEKLALIKNTVLAELAKDLKLPGFRKGHAPAGMAEKAIDQQLLQSRVLEEAVNQMYGEAIANEQVRVASSPEVSISKFVP